MVRYLLINRDQCDVSPAASWVETNPRPALSETLNLLLPHSTYNVTVTAYNDLGGSPEVDSTETTGEMSKY